jgi:hypothetical protein
VKICPKHRDGLCISTRKFCKHVGRHVQIIGGNDSCMQVPRNRECPPHCVDVVPTQEEWEARLAALESELARLKADGRDRA